ncbi:hypothetical protein LDENG_00268890, partial [Lucifuga dentata]
ALRNAKVLESKQYSEYFGGLQPNIKGRYFVIALCEGRDPCCMAKKDFDIVNAAQLLVYIRSDGAAATTGQMSLSNDTPLVMMKLARLIFDEEWIKASTATI